MSKTKKIITSALLISTTSIFANTDIDKRCIVQFFDNVPSSKVESIAKGLANKGNASIRHTYKNSIKGMTLNIPCFAAQAAFGRDENIKSMTPDALVYISKGKPVKDPVIEEPVVDTPAQEVSWGTNKVGSFDGTGKTAWIIDTGIDLDHPDLNVDINRKFTTISSYTRVKKDIILQDIYDDDNGHGTHVAGIIAAIDNEIDTKGVAQGATVVPVKVLDSNGSGSFSDVIAGIDYVSANANAGDCVNLSLGGGVYEPVDNAIINAAANKPNTYFVLAAGNESDDAINHSPARVNGSNIYTVSAVDENNNFAWFSNYGTPVDFAAPGVDIISTWKNAETNTISGTSMAAPHVCAALMSGNVSSDTNAINDPDNIADPIIKVVQ